LGMARNGQRAARPSKRPPLGRPIPKSTRRELTGQDIGEIAPLSNPSDCSISPLDGLRLLPGRRTAPQASPHELRAKNAGTTAGWRVHAPAIIRNAGARAA